MSRLTTRKEADLLAETLDALVPVRMNSKLADVYLQFANSEPALRAYLHMEASIREGSLELREAEALKLWVSQQTGCDYCLSVHSFKAKQAGLNPEAQIAIRKGQQIGEPRLDCLLKVAAHLFRHPRILPSELLEEAYAVGFTAENLVDLTMVMSTIFFTNITNHINDTQSPLPPAKKLSD
ncbi:MAG: AhpD family alkylhydroperoxidase [Granulosicoccus sp.]